jgi:hypothetical protein
MSTLLSSDGTGAVLALEAANTGVGVTKLAWYEPPLIVRSPPTWRCWRVCGGKPLPENRWPNVTTSTLVADGGKSPGHMRASAAAVASVLPNATHQTMPGQTHIFKAKALAPVLRDFLLG